MNRRGFFGKIASLGVSFGLGKVPVAKPEYTPRGSIDRVNICVPHTIEFQSMQEFVAMGGAISPSEVRDRLGFRCDISEPNKG